MAKLDDENPLLGVAALGLAAAVVAVTACVLRDVWLLHWRPYVGGPHIGAMPFAAVVLAKSALLSTSKTDATWRELSWGCLLRLMGALLMWLAVWGLAP